jgi:2-keto-4-pentenoate hydratase/2-oxohepta-3-ene-1,7-dioic acid hydratase in catechol pathway
MVTHLARYRHHDAVSWGVVTGDAISPLSGSYATTADLITDGEADWRNAAATEPSVGLNEIELLSPVTTPSRVVCQGANYRQHAIESGMNPDQRSFNLFFDKTDASVTGPRATVVRPAHVQLLDYEIELALVVRKAVTSEVVVTDANLHEYVFGIAIANDLSARDVQLPQVQFLKGKSYRGFCPVGPYIAVLDRDEFGVLDQLELTLEVNGKQRQTDTTDNMVYRPAESLTELSTFCNLSPGDIILTGTPHGCTATAPPALVRRMLTALLPERRLWEVFIRMQLKRPYLQPGDVVTSQIRSRDASVDLGLQRITIASPTN